MSLILYKKYLLKPIKLQFYSEYCLIDGILLNYKLKFKKNFILNFTKKKENHCHLFIIKNYFRTFFSLILKIVDGISFGYKAILKLKGKGLRLQLKKINNLFIFI